MRGARCWRLAARPPTGKSDLGEALTAAANGIVTAEAKSAFERALALDAKRPQGALLSRRCRASRMATPTRPPTIWRDMLADAPPDAPLDCDRAPGACRRSARRQPCRTAPSAAGAPGPNAADVAAASQMSEQDRNAMIRGMVARLADKLKQNGSDVDGWQRLMRAYMVLGERDKAQAAAGDARQRARQRSRQAAPDRRH